MGWARRLETAAPYAVYLSILAVWEAVSRAGIVPAVLLPPPSKVVLTIFFGFVSPKKIGYQFFLHTEHSLWLLTAGFAAGTAAGIIVGVAMGLNTAVHRVVSPILGFLIPIPALAWTPIMMIWLGAGDRAIFAIVSFACFAEVIFNAVTGVRAVSKLYLWQAGTFGAGRWFTFWRVLLPAAFPSILAGIRLGLAGGWRALIGAEMFAGVTWGLGFMLFDAKQFYATDVMLGALVLVVIFSLLLDQGLLRTIERLTLERWGLTRTIET